MNEKSQEVLAQMRATKTRPFCPCRVPGVPMYIAKIGERYYEKRMPNTGGLHAPSCDHYEPPAELSGLAGVLGSAIQENAEDDTTNLKLNFSMSKIAGRKSVTPGGGEADTVKTDGNKLTLRSLLHYLWDQAGFTKWTPAMEGKRSWWVIRKYLYSAAGNKMVKGDELAGRIFIPETFNKDKSNEINQRHLALMSKMATGKGGSQELMIIIGEVKDIATARNGYKVIVKHLPNLPIMMAEDIHKRLNKRFGNEMSLSNAEGAHLMMIGTIGVSSVGIASLEEAALMAVTENWIPFENTFEKTLLDALTASGRKFIKGLRYNLPQYKPLASVVLPETTPPTAMYVIPPVIDEEYPVELEELIAGSNLTSWQWKTADSKMPDIPGDVQNNTGEEETPPLQQAVVEEISSSCEVNAE